MSEKNDEIIAAKGLTELSPDLISLEAYKEKINEAYLRTLSSNLKSKEDHYELGMLLCYAKRLVKIHRVSFNDFLNEHTLIKSVSHVDSCIVYYTIVKEYPALLNSKLSFTEIHRNNAKIRRLALSGKIFT